MPRTVDPSRPESSSILAIDSIGLIASPRLDALEVELGTRLGRLADIHAAVAELVQRRRTAMAALSVTSTAQEQTEARDDAARVQAHASVLAEEAGMCAEAVVRALLAWRDHVVTAASGLAKQADHEAAPLLREAASKSRQAYAGGGSGADVLSQADELRVKAAPALRRRNQAIELVGVARAKAEAYLGAEITEAAIQRYVDRHRRRVREALG
jgi:hypothetical protein